jgi:hypothetical protein
MLIGSRRALLSSVSAQAFLQANFAVALGDYSALSSLTSMPTGGSITRAGSARYYDTNGVLQTATTNTARFDNYYDTTTNTWKPRGLLVEGASTNYVNYSQQFEVSAEWGPYYLLPVGVDVETAPDGTMTADKIVADTSNNAHLLRRYNSPPFTGTKVYTWSVYAKTAGYSMQLLMYDGVTPVMALGVFDLSAGSYTTTAGTGSITNVGNGWYRCSITGVSAAAPSVSLQDIQICKIGSPSSFAGDGVSGIYIWGAQLEIGNFPSSYIATTTTALARVPDSFTVTGYANQLLESFYVDEATLGNFSGNSAVVTSGATTISQPSFGWVTSLRAYTNGYAGDITTPSWLTFTRGSNAMYYDSTGALTWAPVNLLAYSQDMTPASVTPGRPWVVDNVGGALPTVTINAGTAPDGSNTANRVILNKTGGTFSRIRQDITSLYGPVYLYSVYMKTYAGGTSNVGLRLDGTGINCVVTGTWQRFSMYVASGSAAVSAQLLLFSSIPGNDNTADLLVWGNQLEPVTYQTQPRLYIPTVTAAVFGPRYDYNPAFTPAVPRGLLSEGQNINRASYSQDLSNAVWSPTLYYANVSTNTAIAPDGTLTADSVIADTSNNAHILRRYDAPVFLANTTYTWSVYAKDNGLALQLQLYDGAARANTVFNLTTGTISSTTSGTATITPVGNGWYRCSVTGTTGASVSLSLADIGLNKIGTGNSFTGNGVSGIYAWGAQLEASAFASSYVPVVTGTTTRSADIETVGGMALTTLQAPTGSVITQYTLKGNIVNDQYVIYGNSVSPGYFDSSLVVKATNGTNILSSAQTAVAGTAGRIGFTWSAVPSRSIAYDNTTVVRDGNSYGTIGATVYLGSNNGSNAAYGWLSSIAFYRQAVPNTLLRQKCIVGVAY